MKHAKGFGQGKPSTIPSFVQIRLELQSALGILAAHWVSKFFKIMDFLQSRLWSMDSTLIFWMVWIFGSIWASMITIVVAVQSFYTPIRWVQNQRFSLKIIFQLSKKVVNGDSLALPRGHNHFAMLTDYHRDGRIFNILLSMNGCELMLVSNLVFPIFLNKRDLLSVRGRPYPS